MSDAARCAMDDQRRTRPAEGPQTLHVAAATFPSIEGARAAEATLRTELEIGPDDVSVAELGSLSLAPDRAVLAVRASKSWIEAIRGVVASHGGHVEMDVPESWTGP